MIVVLLLGACAGDSLVNQGNRNGILYLGNGTEPQTIDPHILSGTPEARIANALFEGLVTVNPYTLEILPGVAQRWEYSDDGHLITFYLNPQARFSNGRQITADDVVWSWHRALNPKTGNVVADFLFSVRNAEAYHRGHIDDPAQVGVRAIDPQTVEVELEYPDANALRKFTYIYNAIVPREAILAHGDMTSRFSRWTQPGNLVSSGPFELDEWKMHRYLRVKRNPHYWNAENVQLEGVVFRPVESASTEEKMFRSGQLHATSTVPNSKVPAYRNAADSPLINSPFMGTYYLMLNTRRPPLDDVRVRRALALSIDRETLAHSVLEDTVIASSNYIPQGMPGYDHPQGLDYQPERARQLLAEAGYPRGRGFPDIELVFNTSENHRTVTSAVQQMWKDELNIEVTLANQEWKVYLDTLDTGDYDIGRMGWVADVYPGSFLDPLVTEGGTNRTGFSNVRYDEIILHDTRATTDPKRLMALYREAERLLLEEVQLIPIYNYKSKRLAQPSLEGLPGNLIDTLNLRFVKLDANSQAWQPQASAN
ncbi:peptide ABC transporter substrate-binding protein [Pseudohalioglobus lutimaris]|uniref:peptide ABC transporter substrate-binding protein n=1 Tax=Pseudohalioglobus lutimaris TaxID=1737061 RepID=UPI001FAF04B8|nr:peptide ABC transporter substrate-binding protein [Pseudohalioglobus lutimaris]